MVRHVDPEFSMALVLIVDDHVDTCHLMERLVRRLGPEVAAVHSGAAALSFLAATVPSVVLLDISMPDMNGLDVLEQLRQMPAPAAAVPVVMVTALADEACRRRAFDLGAAGYWVKSEFDACEFAQRLSRFVPLRADRLGR